MYYKFENFFFQYCRNGYNKAYENERSVEIPLGAFFLEKFGKENVLEVGAVMMHYGYQAGRIVDLAEIDPRVENKNALELDYAGQNVLSISTVEHMMKREYNNGSDQDGINFIKKVAREAKNYLITFGIGYNEFIDEWLKSEESQFVGRTILRRVNWNNEWMVDNDKTDYLFGHWDGRSKEIDGFFNNANGLYILHSPDIFK